MDKTTRIERNKKALAFQKKHPEYMERYVSKMKEIDPDLFKKKSHDSYLRRKLKKQNNN